MVNFIGRFYTKKQYSDEFEVTNSLLAFKTEEWKKGEKLLITWLFSLSL